MGTKKGQRRKTARRAYVKTPAERRRSRRRSRTVPRTYKQNVAARKKQQKRRARRAPSKRKGYDIWDWLRGL